jgi:hypothetical protein
MADDRSSVAAVGGPRRLEAFDENTDSRSKDRLTADDGQRTI